MSGVSAGGNTVGAPSGPMGLARGDYVVWHSQDQMTSKPKTNFLLTRDWWVGKVTSVGGPNDCSTTDVGVLWHGTAVEGMAYTAPKLSFLPFQKKGHPMQMISDVLKLEDFENIILKEEDFDINRCLTDAALDKISGCLGFNVQNHSSLSMVKRGRGRPPKRKRSQKTKKIQPITQGLEVAAVPTISGSQTQVVVTQPNSPESKTVDDEESEALTKKPQKTNLHVTPEEYQQMVDCLCRTGYQPGKIALEFPNIPPKRIYTFLNTRVNAARINKTKLGKGSKDLERNIKSPSFLEEIQKLQEDCKAYAEECRNAGLGWTMDGGKKGGPVSPDKVDSSLRQITSNPVLLAQHSKLVADIAAARKTANATPAGAGLGEKDPLEVLGKDQLSSLDEDKQKSGEVDRGNMPFKRLRLSQRNSLDGSKIGQGKEVDADASKEQPTTYEAKHGADAQMSDATSSPNIPTPEMKPSIETGKKYDSSSGVSREGFVLCMHGALFVADGHSMCKGFWSKASEFLLEDQDKNEFQLRSKLPTTIEEFPHSGVYTGFFYMDDAKHSLKKKRVNEGKLTISFKRKDQNQFTVLGAGKNTFGSYRMDGVLHNDGRVEMNRKYGVPEDFIDELNKTLSKPDACQKKGKEADNQEPEQDVQHKKVDDPDPQEQSNSLDEDISVLDIIEKTLKRQRTSVNVGTSKKSSENQQTTDQNDEDAKKTASIEVAETPEGKTSEEKSDSIEVEGQQGDSLNQVESMQATKKTNDDRGGIDPMIEETKETCESPKKVQQCVADENKEGFQLSMKEEIVEENTGGKHNIKENTDKEQSTEKVQIHNDGGEQSNTLQAEERQSAAHEKIKVHNEEASGADSSDDEEGASPEKEEEVIIWDTKDDRIVDNYVKKKKLAQYLIEHMYHECYYGQDSPDYEVPLWNMKKNARDKRKIVRKRMAKVISSRPYLRIYCNQDRKARILIWDTEQKRRLEEEYCPRRKKLAKYLARYPTHEIYYGQDQERVALWDMKRQKKIPGPRQTELVAYLIANPTHEVYQRQERRQRVFLWNPVGSGDRIMVAANKVKELFQANPSWDHYHNQDRLNRVPIWDPKMDSRIRYEAQPCLDDLQVFLRLHPEVQIYTLQDKEELDRKDREREERERKAREEEARRKAELAAKREKIKAFDEKTKNNPVIRMWNCKEWCEVSLTACPRWSNLTEYLIMLPDHFPYKGQDDPEYKVSLYDTVQKKMVADTILKREMEDFFQKNTDLEPYCNQDGKQLICLYDTRTYDKIKSYHGPTRNDLRKCLCVNKHHKVLIDEVAFVDITDAELKEQEKASAKSEEATSGEAPSEESKEQDPESKTAEQAEGNAQGSGKSAEQNEAKQDTESEIKSKATAKRPPKKKKKPKKTIPRRRGPNPFKNYLYFEEVVESRDLKKLDKYKILNHGHGVSMTLFSAKDFRCYMAWKDARTKREEEEKQAKQKARERKTHTSALTGFSVMD